VNATTPSQRDDEQRGETGSRAVGTIESGVRGAAEPSEIRDARPHAAPPGREGEQRGEPDENGGVERRLQPLDELPARGTRIHRRLAVGHFPCLASTPESARLGLSVILVSRTGVDVCAG